MLTAFLLTVVAAGWFPKPVLGSDFNVTADVGVPGPAMPEAWKSMTMWDWHTWLDGPTDPLVSARYPYLKMVTFFTATGGCNPSYAPCNGTDRDLFSDPTNPASPLNLTKWLDAIGNVVQSGLLPYIVVANVPIALSSPPKIGAFGVNAALPANMTAYRQYVANIAQGAVERFGLQQVQTWRWGVFTEYNNQDWLIATAEQYFSVYDYTMCGLEDVLGQGTVIGGAHACTQCNIIDPSLHWDAVLLLDHVTSGTNYCRGTVGSPMSFITNSFYETAPGNPGNFSGSRGFQESMGPLINKAKEVGLGNIEFGIDEGRLLQGTDNLALTTRAVGWTYQASWDALFMTNMVYSGVSYYSRWGVNTGGQNGLWGVDQHVDNVASHVAYLTHWLVGDSLVPVQVTPGSGSAADPASMVNATVTFNATTRAVRALVAHHHPDPAFNGSVTVAVQVCGLPPAMTTAGLLLPGPQVGKGSGTAVSMNETRVDDSHGQFWSAWMSDAVSNGVTSINPGWSNSSDSVTLGKAQDQAYWRSRVPAYQQMAQMATVQVQAVLDGTGCLSWTTVMPHHGVALYQATV